MDAEWVSLVVKIAREMREEERSQANKDARLRAMRAAASAVERRLSLPTALPWARARGKPTTLDLRCAWHDWPAWVDRMEADS